MASRLLRASASTKLVFTLTPQYNAASMRSFHSTQMMQEKLFNKILIANRGEIACRVMRTAKRLGIKTVAVYSEPDVNSLHVRMADEAVCVGPAPSNQSYLKMDHILNAIKQTGAEAVHPGYGFLSENSKFAHLLEENGVTFIGPPSSAVSAMGDKIESKKLATKAGVHVIPGRLTDADNIEEVLKMANEIGYPVMIKASAGGGGKGMRVAWSEEEAREGFRLAKQEALASFGDDRILIEKYIDNPRHIEIQVLGDGQGTTLYFNERECSIQRRNQKVLEEAPSSFIDAATRKAMGEQAVALANAVGYKSAGTVEFLVDSKRNFYFLEMNTRLQVEHPITEFITGQDLVELMIRVAAGQKLKLKQSDIGIKGWAMESRVYAEDPLRNFLPSIGNLYRYQEPTSTDGSVRVDAGVREGDDISVYYDPLISKLVTYGKDRQEAIRKMAHALDTYVIRGVNHNVCFLRSMMEHPRYVSGDISTKFIQEEFPKGFHGHHLSLAQTEELLASAAVIHHLRQVRDFSIDGKLNKSSHAFNHAEGDYVITLHGNQHHNVKVVDLGEGQFEVQVDGQKKIALNTSSAADSLIFEANVASKDVVLQQIDVIPQGYRLQHYGTQFDVLVQSPRAAELSKLMPVKAKADTSKVLNSPMPGRIFSVSVKDGQTVHMGQELVIVEAMKMQNVLRAPKDCKVKAVKVKQGQDVVVDQVLIDFE